MQALFEAIREECAPRTWSRGVELVRAGGVEGQRVDDTELVFRVRDRALMTTPRVTLWIEGDEDDSDWDCDCAAKVTPCRHVAAAIIALRRAREEGKDLPAASGRSARLGYRLRRTPDGLEFTRVVVLGERESPVRHPIAAMVSGREGPRVSATQPDQAVEQVLGTSATRPAVLPRALMVKLVPALADCADIRLDGKEITASSEPVFLHGRLSDAKQGDGFRLHLVRDRAITEAFRNGAVLCGDVLRAFGESGLSRRELQSLSAGVHYRADQVAQLVTDVIPSLSRRIPFKVRTKRLPRLKEARLRAAFATSGSGETLSVLPTLVYGSPAIARVDGERLVLLGGGIPRRDSRAERSLASRLHAELGLTPGQRLTLTGGEAVHFVERLQAFGGEWTGDAHHRFRRVQGVTPQLRVQGGGFSMRFVREGEEDDASDGALAAIERQGQGAEPGLGGLEDLAAAPGLSGFADPKRVLEAWENGEEMVPLLDGGWAPLPADWLGRYGDSIAFLLAARGEDGRLARWAAPALVKLCKELDQPPTPEFARLQSLVGSFEGIPEAALPSDLTATLRDYQRRGVDWLTFLKQAGLGAMLADDMGLGKTLQALCAIRGRTLVVAPTSVLHNWAIEIAEFRPSLTSVVYHGPKRALDPDAAVTLTTYAILRLDIELLVEQDWDAVILDEAQAIKNPTSKVAQAAFRLSERAAFRATLTGTPVENRLEELWSQFHFLNRGLLGGRREFQDRYAKPIAAGLKGVARQLRERIRPFLLRRRKSEVVKELPPRTDVVLRCQLDEEERRVYDAIRVATRKEVLEKLQGGGGVLQALEVLLRLRQASCHRGLLPGHDAGRSSKLDLLRDVLDGAVAEGHKALVFSQWTKLLDRVEPVLEGAGVAFTRLDGRTRDRGGVVAEFQDPDGPPVMLISLKAGGTGLNLTAADHVFLLDPWWNPAVEDQAADRAHRIGQERPVLVHRLVAEDTVEERILDLQQRKRALADAALEGADQGASITREDLLALLE